MKERTSQRKARRRVLMTADAVGGVWNYAVELAGALQPFDFDVLLAVLGPSPSPSQLEEIASLPHVTMISRSFKLEWMESPWTDVRRAGDWLLELEREWRPHVVHLNSYSYASLAWAAPALVVGHSCVLSWWRSVKGSDAPAEWRRYKQVVERGLASANIVVSPTWAMLSALREYYKWQSPAVVIPNGISGRAFSQTAKAEFVLAVGRIWDDAKNLAALNDVSSAIPWPILAVGDSSFARNTARNFGLQSLGHLSSSATRDWMSAAGIYALPAKYEPFGLSILEAAWAGCPLVLGDIDSLRENWVDAALFVEPGDRTQLADSLNMLIHNPALRMAFGDRARSRARHFGSERMAESYASLYRSLCTGRMETWRRNYGLATCAL